MKEIENSSEFPQLEDILKEKPESEKSTSLVCEFCGKNIKRKTWNKRYWHINICQEPVKRFFCSHECKLSWIFEIPEGVSEII